MCEESVCQKIENAADAINHEHHDKDQPKRVVAVQIVMQVLDHLDVGLVRGA